jgi:hypothetical protein
MRAIVPAMLHATNLRCIPLSGFALLLAGLLLRLAR